MNKKELEDLINKEVHNPSVARDCMSAIFKAEEIAELLGEELKPSDIAVIISCHRTIGFIYRHNKLK